MLHRLCSYCWRNRYEKRSQLCVSNYLLFHMKSGMHAQYSVTTALLWNAKIIVLLFTINVFQEETKNDGKILWNKIAVVILNSYSCALSMHVFCILYKECSNEDCFADCHRADYDCVDSMFLFCFYLLSILIRLSMSCWLCGRMFAVWKSYL